MKTPLLIVALWSAWAGADRRPLAVAHGAGAAIVENGDGTNFWFEQCKIELYDRVTITPGGCRRVTSSRADTAQVRGLVADHFQSYFSAELRAHNNATTGLAATLAAVPGALVGGLAVSLTRLAPTPLRLNAAAVMGALITAVPAGVYAHGRRVRIEDENGLRQRFGDADDREAFVLDAHVGSRREARSALEDYRNALVRSMDAVPAPLDNDSARSY